MRLLHVVPTYLPATRYGGPIYAVHGLCRALVRRGHQVDVFTTNVDGAHNSDVPTGVAVNMDGVSVHYFPSTLRRLYVSPQMRAALAKSVGQYDAVHLHSIFLWPTYAAARAARKEGVAYVVSPRGMLVPELVAQKSRFAKMLWIRAIERRTFAQAAAIHFTANSERDDARRMSMPIPDSFVVPNGIDLPQITTTARLPGTLLCLGRINWKKGLDRVIDAMPHLHGAHVIIAGNDEEELTPKLRAQAERNGVADRIEFRGPVSGEAKEVLLQTSTALVLPSHSENFGNVVLEAMAAAMPVIVSPEVGLANDVAQSGAGLVTSSAPESLAEAIRKVLGDSALRAEMGRRGRQLVEEQFTWDHVAELMEAQYERISGRARATPL
ncbi:MAG: glycosyltransferase [Acidobacteria bacterium]|nr:glycosyltransferase [Acidobacteriota bacterium]MBV9071327.1 glycosyltransferase [Acidobacteriota bacterium]MBV9188166.1 glycosyltransferase [Acidobacteriota bacterium]